MRGRATSLRAAVLRLIVAVIAGAAPTAAAAQEAAGPASSAAELEVYLLTMGPGDEIWERFGHNAILLRDPTTGSEVAYNYGMFSFNQPGFIRRLLMGRMLYWMQPIDGQLMLSEYILRNRTVWAQELDLTPQQKADLQQFLDWNAQPANRDYLYDPFRDNCSTRVRDALDRVLDGQLRASLRTMPADGTFRSHSLRLLDDEIGAYTGLLLALGQPMDARISRWEEAFIPMQLREAVQRVIVVDESGERRPLVRAERVLFLAQRDAPPAAPPARMWIFMLAGALIAATFLALGHVAGRSTAVRLLTAVVATLWSLAVGLFGTVILLLWMLTDHSYTYMNENLFVANPLVLLLAPLAFLALALRRATGPAAAVAATVAALAGAGVLLQLLPALDQQNGEILALLGLPSIALGIVLVLWHRQVSLNGDGK